MTAFAAWLTARGVEVAGTAMLLHVDPARVRAWCAGRGRPSDQQLRRIWSATIRPGEVDARIAAGKPILPSEVELQAVAMGLAVVQRRRHLRKLEVSR